MLMVFSSSTATPWVGVQGTPDQLVHGGGAGRLGQMGAAGVASLGARGERKP